MISETILKKSLVEFFAEIQREYMEEEAKASS